ncbi:MAG: hypothetical protein Q8N55_01890 [bacterium]|nr:hypothetical protein [bacterium]
MEEDPTFFVADVDCVVGEKPLSILCSDGRKGDIRRLPSQLADDEIIFFNDAFKEGIKIVKQRESGSDNGTLYFIRI